MTTTEDPFPEDEATTSEPPAADGSDAFGQQIALTDGSDSGTLEVLPPARGVLSEARAMLQDNVAMLDDAWRVADIVCQTPAAPHRYRGKAKEGTVAIMYGAELGLPPMASLQKVINIHGSPSLEARTMKGILKAKGFKFRTIAKSATEYEIWAWEPDSPVVIEQNPASPHYGRRILPDEEANWTIERAIQARYVPTPSSDDSLRRPDVDSDWVTVSKSWDGRTKTSVVGNMKYITDPITMLEAKGTADVCRTIAPEIFLGLPYAAEERADWAHEEDDEEEPQPKRRGRAKGVSALRDRAKAAGVKAEERAEAAADNEPQDAEVVDEASEAREQLEEHDEAVAEAMAAEPAEAPADEAQQAPADTGSGAPSAEAPEAPAAATPPAAAPDPAPQDSGAAVPPDAASSGPAAEGEPASAAAAPDPITITKVEGTTGEDLPGPAPAAEQPTPQQAPAADGLEMSEEMRGRGERLLANLLTEAKIEAEDEVFDVVSEILTKLEGHGKYRRVSELYEITNRELKGIVDILRARKENGTLYTYCGEALNAAALRQAGMTEGQ